LASEVKRLGAAAPTAHSTSLPTTLESVIATLADLEVWQYFQLDLQLPPDLPAVMIERVILRQILLNVLSHFLVIGRRGRIEISASVSGDQLTLSVGYQGQVKPDIPADGEDHRLAVATRLAQVQAGELLISDDETTIRLSLPVEQQATVLVVDDNPDLIQLFRRYLTNSPFRLVGVSSSRQALSTAQKVTPQVIILDVMMPTQDGWELLQYLKNHPATHHIPVIICSVLKERELALSLGAQAFLAKPVSRQMLLTALGPYKSGRPVGAHPTRLADSASSRPPKNPLAW
jgi:CheY-like chemotaxis protein